MNISVITLLADRILKGWGLSGEEAEGVLLVPSARWTALVAAADRGEARVPDGVARIMVSVIALKEMLDDRGLSDEEAATWIRGMRIGSSSVLELMTCGTPGFNIVFTRAMIGRPA